MSRTDDLALRKRRYLAMQAVRMACVMLAALLPISLWGKGLFMVGAVVLPWIGVVTANAGPARSRERKDRRAAAPTASEPLVAAPLGLSGVRVVDEDGVDVG